MEKFADGYRAAGGTLPEDRGTSGWLELARLVDATRLVAIVESLETPRDVVAECAALLTRI